MQQTKREKARVSFASSMAYLKPWLPTRNPYCSGMQWPPSPGDHKPMIDWQSSLIRHSDGDACKLAEISVNQHQVRFK